MKISTDWIRKFQIQNFMKIRQY